MITYILVFSSDYMKVEASSLRINNENNKNKPPNDPIVKLWILKVVVQCFYSLFSVTTTVDKHAAMLDITCYILRNLS